MEKSLACYRRDDSCPVAMGAGPGDGERGGEARHSCVTSSISTSEEYVAVVNGQLLFYGDTHSTYPSISLFLPL